MIVDAGCFLGGSTLALASGLRANPRFPAASRRDVIHAYDLFVVEPWTIGIYFPHDMPHGMSFDLRFRENIAPLADLVAVHPGNVMKAPVIDAPIEILFIDLAKHWTVNDYLGGSLESASPVRRGGGSPSARKIEPEDGRSR